ncbi:MAG: M48 family metallopeptidase [Patescibacteria group bacterium]|jgi:hypothetical protein
MRKQIKIQDKEINYTLKTSYKARVMRLAIYHDGNFVVTKPWGLPVFAVERFIKKKADWILEKLEYFKKADIIIIKNSRAEYFTQKEVALNFIENKLKEFNKIYNFSYNRISIRNQRSRWGSCSRKGNLNFNYRILSLPEYLADYIIVHELCHLREFNHSQKFWHLVSLAIPEYKKRRKELRKMQF